MARYRWNIQGLREWGIRTWKFIANKRIVISQHSFLQSVCRHLKFCATETRGHYRLVRCSRPSKWRALLTWKRQSVRCSLDKSIQWQWFNGGFVRIMAKKNLRENIFTSGRNSLLNLVEFVIRRKIRADDQVTRLWSVFTYRLFRSPQKSTWRTSSELGYISHMTVWRVLRKRLSFRQYKSQLM
jgi:hypothetical protein